MGSELLSALDARARLEQAVEGSDRLVVMAAARDLSRELGGTRAIQALRAVAARADRTALGFKTTRVALLSSFSIELIHDALEAYGFMEGLDVEIYQAGFGQFRQEILNTQSGLYGFEPDLTVLAVEAEQWMPEIFNSYLSSMPPDLEAQLERAVAEVTALASAFARQSRGMLLVHGADAPVFPSLGMIDGKPSVGQRELVMRFNLRLYEALRPIPNVFLLDYREEVAALGRDRWYDPRMAHYAKAPVSPAGLQRLAATYVRYLRAYVGGALKCVILDLDNTLWGGVIGEDGLEGIRLGPDYPGSAFMAFQHALAILAKRGILLAIASKNNPDDAWEVFDKHRHMVLRREDISTAEINWGAKSESIARIAKSLNLGLEHLVFVDDNPAECEQVRGALPAVTVIELPRAPEAFVHALLQQGLFDSLTFSEEDRRRTALYRQRQEAQEMQERVGSLDDYLRQLRMAVSVETISDATIARAAQMTQKTNQFNVTTPRYTEGDIRERLASPDWVVLGVRVADRFGDHGLVGLMLAKAADNRLVIDTLLMSCRVIGRTVETAMLSVLCSEATNRGLVAVVGRIVPTAKNIPVRDLFERHGFELVDGTKEAESTWRLDLSGSHGIACPEWIELGQPA